MYKLKYLKYKTKYNNLKKMSGGDIIKNILEDLEYLIISLNNLFHLKENLKIIKSVDSIIFNSTNTTDIFTTYTKINECKNTFKNNFDSYDDTDVNDIIDNIINEYNIFIEENNIFNIYGTIPNKNKKDKLKFIFYNFFNNQIGGVLSKDQTNKIIEALPRLDVLGQGTYGKVYHLIGVSGIDQNIDDKVIKHELRQTSNSELNMTKEIYTELFNLNIGPQLHDTYYDTNTNHGGIIMEKFVSDVNKLLSKYFLTDDQLESIENTINTILNKMLSESDYICLDLKFGNMLANYTVRDDTVVAIDKIVLSDFDTNFCHNITKIQYDYDNIRFIKYLFYINLIMSQININIIRIQNYIKYEQFKKRNFKLLSLFLSKIDEIKDFFSKKKKFILEKMNNILSNIKNIINFGIAQQLCYIIGGGFTIRDLSSLRPNEILLLLNKRIDKILSEYNSFDICNLVVV